MPATMDSSGLMRTASRSASAQAANHCRYRRRRAVSARPRPVPRSPGPKAAKPSSAAARARSSWDAVNLGLRLPRRCLHEARWHGQPPAAIPSTCSPSHPCCTDAGRSDRPTASNRRDLARPAAADPLILPHPLTGSDARYRRALDQSLATARLRAEPLECRLATAH